MNRDGHNQVNFFIGAEVEHTPAFSKRTLFVVGEQPIDSILEHAIENKVAHIFMGANHSFLADQAVSEYWDNTITQLLDKGYWVTLDYQAHQHTAVLAMLNAGIWQCRTFVPLLSVRIENVQTSSPNLTIKIDDVDFNSTNPGVWCLHHHEITDSNRFTGWTDYSTDEVIKPKSAPAVAEKQPAPAVAEKQPAPAAAEPVAEVKNDAKVGIDQEPTSALKPDVDGTDTVPSTELTPDAALNAYTEGAGEQAATQVKAAKGRK